MREIRRKGNKTTRWSKMKGKHQGWFRRMVWRGVSIEYEICELVSWLLSRLFLQNETVQGSNGLGAKRIAASKYAESTRIQDNKSVARRSSGSLFGTSVPSKETRETRSGRCSKSVKYVWSDQVRRGPDASNPITYVAPRYPSTTTRDKRMAR